LINDGVTVMGDTVSVQWQGTGPYEIFRCRINQLQPVQNRGQQEICKFRSIIYSNEKYGYCKHYYWVQLNALLMFKIDQDLVSILVATVAIQMSKNTLTQ